MLQVSSNGSVIDQSKYNSLPNTKFNINGEFRIIDKSVFKDTALWDHIKSSENFNFKEFIDKGSKSFTIEALPITLFSIREHVGEFNIETFDLITIFLESQSIDELNIFDLDIEAYTRLMEYAKALEIESLVKELKVSKEKFLIKSASYMPLKCAQKALSSSNKDIICVAKAVIDANFTYKVRIPQFQTLSQSPFETRVFVSAYKAIGGNLLNLWGKALDNKDTNLLEAIAQEKEFQNIKVLTTDGEINIPGSLLIHSTFLPLLLEQEEKPSDGNIERKEGDNDIEKREGNKYIINLKGKVSTHILKKTVQLLTENQTLNAYFLLYFFLSDDELENLMTFTDKFGICNQEGFLFDTLKCERARRMSLDEAKSIIESDPSEYSIHLEKIAKAVITVDCFLTEGKIDPEYKFEDITDAYVFLTICIHRKVNFEEFTNKYLDRFPKPKEILKDPFFHAFYKGTAYLSRLSEQQLQLKFYTFLWIANCRDFNVISKKLENYDNNEKIRCLLGLITGSISSENIHLIEKLLNHTSFTKLEMKIRVSLIGYALSRAAALNQREILEYLFQHEEYIALGEEIRGEIIQYTLGSAVKFDQREIIEFIFNHDVFTSLNHDQKLQSIPSLLKKNHYVGKEVLEFIFNLDLFAFLNENQRFQCVLSALKVEASTNRKEIVEFIFNHEVFTSLNYYQRFQCVLSALKVEAFTNKKEIVEFIFNHDAFNSLNEIQRFQCVLSALKVEASTNRKELLEFIFNHDAFNSLSDYKRFQCVLSALKVEASTNRKELLEFIFNHDAFNSLSDYKRFQCVLSALKVEASTNRKELVEYILGHEQFIALDDSVKARIIICVAHKARNRLIQELLNRHLELISPEGLGRALIHLSQDQQHEEARYLIDLNIFLNIPTRLLINRYSDSLSFSNWMRVKYRRCPVVALSWAGAGIDTFLSAFSP